MKTLPIKGVGQRIRQFSRVVALTTFTEPLEKENA
jgi:hypothetical protein